MIIIDENAEAKLIQTLETCKGKAGSPRCLQLHLSGTKKTHRDIQSHLQTSIPPAEAQVYVCEDGDVFILAPRLMLSDARGLASSLNIPVILHELVHGWRPVFAAVEEKLLIIWQREQAEEKERKSLRRKIVRQNILESPVDSSLVRTIEERRARHALPAVMVVEDDAFSRKLVQNALHGVHQVTVLGEGRHVLEVYAEHAPHVLFLDIDLPDVSGHDLLKRICTMDPDAYVVMLSGNGDRNNVLQAVESGAKGFVGKPFSRDRLFQHIHRCPLVPSQPATGGQT